MPAPPHDPSIMPGLLGADQGNQTVHRQPRRLAQMTDATAKLAVTYPAPVHCGNPPTCPITARTRVLYMPGVPGPHALSGGSLFMPHTHPNTEQGHTWLFGGHMETSHFLGHKTHQPGGDPMAQKQHGQHIPGTRPLIAGFLTQEATLPDICPQERGEFQPRREPQQYVG